MNEFELIAERSWRSIPCMSGGQSQQPDKLPTAPDEASAAQAQKAPTIPEPRSGQPHQVPTKPDTGKKQSTLRKGIRAVFGPIGALIAALLGFLLGIASTQVSDYVKRAGDCAEALEQYATGVAGNFGYTYYTNHDPNASDDKKQEVTSKYIAQVDAPHDKAVVVCPLDLTRGTEYLDGNAVKDFHASYGRMDRCVQWVGCPQDSDNILAIAESALLSTKALTTEALGIPAWGLERRTEYVILHLH
jgi:hypothetical protein